VSGVRENGAIAGGVRRAEVLHWPHRFSGVAAMPRTILLAAAVAFAAPAFAQTIFKHVDPNGRVTYSDEPPAGGGNTVVQPPPSTGHYVNQQPGGVQAPGTIPQSALPSAPQPTANLPRGGGPDTIPSAAVPGPGSESTPGSAPNTAGDRFINVPAGERRIDEDAARRNVMQGERAREAADTRLNVEPGEAARMRGDMRTDVPAGEGARDRRDMQIGVPAGEAQRERDAAKLNQ